jgi:hypothetical protein
MTTILWLGAFGMFCFLLSALSDEVWAECEERHKEVVEAFRVATSLLGFIAFVLGAGIGLGKLFGSALTFLLTMKWLGVILVSL